MSRLAQTDALPVHSSAGCASSGVLDRCSRPAAPPLADSAHEAARRIVGVLLAADLIEGAGVSLQGVERVNDSRVAHTRILRLREEAGGQRSGVCSSAGAAVIAP